jgi:succinyl-diaminopimelate desuccinylase
LTGMLEAELAELTVELVNIPSVSRHETDLLERVRAWMPDSFEESVADAVLLYLPPSPRPASGTVILAGHVDTVPFAPTHKGQSAGELADRRVWGRGACDMKGALAVMLLLARELGAGGLGSDLDVGFLFFGREEIPITDSALLPFLKSRPDLRCDLAIVMEPTDNGVELGCLGNLNAKLVFRGRAAHTARPWLGANAIHGAVRALAPLTDLPVRDVEVGGLVFREAISITSIAGGLASNVVPDLCEVGINFRYAPNLSPQQAEARLRELLSGDRLELQIVANAPPGGVVTANALLDRLRSAADLPVGPKQAWSPVSEFTICGYEAVNLGPGDPRYAHSDEEQVAVDSLVRSFEILRAFLEAGA